MRRTEIGHDFLRFLVAGGINTIVTAVIYAIGILVVPPVAAYSAAWAIGLILVVWIYPEAVFRDGRRSLADRAMIGGILVFVFLIGVLALRTFAPVLGNLVAFGATLVVTTLANFALMRLVLRRSP